MHPPATPTPLHEIHDLILTKREVRMLIKRDDLIHPAVPGNKWRKLTYNLAEARRSGHSTLLTFGGAYSNHVSATASAGKLFGLRTIGVIRGEEHLPLNEVLRHATACGMTLHYLDRGTYRRKYDPAVIASLRRQYGEFYLLPEGGTNCLGLQGCAEIIDEIGVPFDYICCAMGTGGTLAGLVAGLRGRAKAVGFSSLKGGSFLEADVRGLLDKCQYPANDNWSVIVDYHFGGFAKRTAELDRFIETFYERHGVVLDFVYTGKMMYGVFDLVRKGYFASGSTVIALHTGGVDASKQLPFHPVPNGKQGQPG